METRALGQTGIQVSPLGLGTTKFGRNQGVKYPSGFELPSEDGLADLISIAKRAGINLIDTAPAYGVAEERLGRLLKGQRKDWVIVGKAGEEFEETEDGGQSTYNFDPAYFEKSLHRSLERLQTDYLDVFLIHSDGNDMNILNNDTLIYQMEEFKKQGLVRAIGASTKTMNGGIRCLEVMDVVMASYNPEYTVEKPVLDYAASYTGGVLLKKALSSGHNTNIETAFETALSHPGVSSVIAGTINPQHLRDNIEAVSNILTL